MISKRLRPRQHPQFDWRAMPMWRRILLAVAWLALIIVATAALIVTTYTLVMSQ
jgi:anti-sigma-K factor RskA